MTQNDRLKSLFLSKPNEWVPLHTILSMGIAQYNARIYELRHSGMEIENMTRKEDGGVHSWFRFVPKEMERVG